MKPILKKNKKGGFTDLFLFMIVSVIIVLFCGIFIYMATTIHGKLQEEIPKLNINGAGDNSSVILENTMGKAVESFNSLYWIATVLIFGMILSIFIGSYLVTTKPIFFIPYLFIVIIAVIISAGISNAYELMASNSLLQPTFYGFSGANWIILKFPIVISIIGIAGAIIMFTRLGKDQGGGQTYYGY